MKQTVYSLQTDMLQPLLSETNRTIDYGTKKSLKIRRNDFRHFRRLLLELMKCFKSCDDCIGWFYGTHLHRGIISTFHFNWSCTRMNGALMKMQQTVQELQIELFDRNDNIIIHLILPMEQTLHQSIPYGMEW